MGGQVTDWPRVKEHILAALEYGGNTHGEEDVLTGINERKYQLWPGHRSAVVTEVIQYPRLKAVRIWLAGGDLQELMGMERAISAWAKDIGASRIEIGGGRPGWERTLKDYRRLCPCAVKEL